MRKVTTVLMLAAVFSVTLGFREDQATFVGFAFLIAAVLLEGLDQHREAVSSHPEVKN